MKTKLQGRIKDLEDELKKTREDIEKKNQAAQEQENEVPYLKPNKTAFPFQMNHLSLKPSIKVRDFPRPNRGPNIEPFQLKMSKIFQK